MLRHKEFVASFKCDVVHVHWVCGAFMNARALNSISKSVRVVLTMHDGFGLYGVEHYRQQFARMFFWCSVMGYFSSRHRSKLIKGYRIIVPSRWLYNQVAASYIAGQNRLFYLPNTLDNETQVSAQRAITKTTEQIDRGGSDLVRPFRISMGAMTGDSDGRKGIRQALNILEKLQRPFVLTTFGGGEPFDSEYCIEHVNHGLLSQDQVLDVFADSDLVLVPAL